MGLRSKGTLALYFPFFLIRNSWGSDWGDAGYGWLPYEYVLNKLATDFWPLLNMDWVAADRFGV